MSIKTPTRSPIRSASKNQDSATKKLVILQREYQLNKLDIQRLEEENSELEKQTGELKTKKSRLSHTLKAEKKVISLKADEIKQEFNVKTTLENEKARMQILEINQNKNTQRQGVVDKLKNVNAELQKVFAENISAIQDSINNFKAWQYKEQSEKQIQDAVDNRSLSETEQLNQSLKTTLKSLHPESIVIPDKAELKVSQDVSFFEINGEDYHDKAHNGNNVTYTRYVVVKPHL